MIGAGAGFQANGSKAASEFSLTLKTDKGKVLLKFQEALLTVMLPQLPAAAQTRACSARQRGLIVINQNV